MAKVMKKIILLLYLAAATSAELIVRYEEEIQSEHKPLSTYRAGVVEYHPSSDKDASEKNLEEYLKIIKKASKQKVDILVFPEATLNRRGVSCFDKTGAIVVPDEDEKIVACGDESYSLVLQRLSCAARDEKMYIVVNVAEIVYCHDDEQLKNLSDCEDILFNTNVVFDRSGTIISRYRKIHLFGEKGYTPSLDKSLGLFETDFGVKFAHFICFDLLFQRPAVASASLVQNIIFPTMWFSGLPSLTAVEIQQAWAYTHNVNFLAAGANNPAVGSSGSGIYSGKSGALTAIILGVPKTELLIADVPKTPAQKDPARPNVMRQESIDSLRLSQNKMKSYISKVIDENVPSQEHHLTYGNTTCIFKIKSKRIKSEKAEAEHYSYRTIIFDGLRSFVYKNGGIVECGIIACTSDDFSSCGLRFKDRSAVERQLEFERIEINARVRKPMFNETMKTMDSAYYPVTLSTDILPLPFNQYQYSERDDLDMMMINMTVDSPKPELLWFGIFGRTYYLDD